MKRIAVLLLVLMMLTGCTDGGSQSTKPMGEQNTTAPVVQPEESEMPNGFTGLGGKMPELAVNSTDGRTLSVSQLLKEKKLVVINFWFEDCPWCLKEFPAMELTYQKYKENVEILALNPADETQDIRSFRAKYSLTIPMAACSATLPRYCGVSAYPTSIFIDRYGVVSLIHVGAITAAGDWEAIFDTFTAEDYRQTVYPDIDEILG